MESPYLNDVEKSKLEGFVEDKVLQIAVKKALLAGIYSDGTLKPGKDPEVGKNWVFNLFGSAQITPSGIIPKNELNDAELGQRLRALVDAHQLLENSFRELEQYKKVVAQEEKQTNEAR